MFKRLFILTFVLTGIFLLLSCKSLVNSDGFICKRNQKAIDDAITMYNMENNRPCTSINYLTPYIEVMPKCPKNDILYNIPTVGKQTVCPNAIEEHCR